LDKVSLERLADINPELLMNIKRAAEEGINLVASHPSTSSSVPALHKGTTATKSLPHPQSTVPAFLIETRSASTIQRSNEWHSVFMQQNKSSLGNINGTVASIPSSNSIMMMNDIVQSLHQLITEGCTNTSSAPNADMKEENQATTKLYTQREALSMIQYYGTCSAVAQLLQDSASTWQPAEGATNALPQLGRTNTAAPSDRMMFPNDESSTAMISNLLKVHVHAADFNTEGLKKKSAFAISLLYELGLPFQSTADGKRFRTQQQLSYHLDRIFQQKQRANKLDAATSMERGWYMNELRWTMGEDVPQTLEQTSTEDANAGITNVGTPDHSSDPNILFTVPADESRDSCIVCGIKFVMFFDTNEGQYKYRNCREIPIDMDLDSDVALENEDEADMQFVHGTCWIGLGQPNSLSYDQTIYNTQ
jgi:pre-mRNA cleavage complex 2 protein Pcf11